MSKLTMKSAGKRAADDESPVPPSSARRVRARALERAKAEAQHLAKLELIEKTQSVDVLVESTSSNANLDLFSMLCEALKTVKALEERNSSLSRENKSLKAQIIALGRDKRVCKPQVETIEITKLSRAFEHARKLGFQAGKLEMIDQLKRVIESLEFAYEVKYGALQGNDDRFN
jgi:hypothetical protein